MVFTTTQLRRLGAAREASSARQWLIRCEALRESPMTANLWARAAELLGEEEQTKTLEAADYRAAKWAAALPIATWATLENGEAASFSPYPQSRFPPSCIFMYIHVFGAVYRKNMNIHEGGKRD